MYSQSFTAVVKQIANVFLRGVKAGNYLQKILYFPEKMSDFTETPHFNHNSVKGSHYTVIIKKKKRQQNRKKAKRKAPVIPRGDGSFREFLRYKD